MTEIPNLPHHSILFNCAANSQAVSPISLSFQPGSEKPAPGQLSAQVGDLLVVKNGNLTTLHISLGNADPLQPESFRKAGGAAGKWLASSTVSSADLSVVEIETLAVPGGLAALLEGLRLGAYKFTRFKKNDSSNAVVTIHLRGETPTDNLASVVDHANKLTSAVMLAREWAHEPANVINPLSLADRAKTLAGQYGLKCTILDEQMLAEIKAGALLAVGEGSQTPPRLIILEYAGKNAPADTRPVALVGKALTFDSGGYSLKNPENIQGMKYDKCGGLTVLAVMQAAAELGLSAPLIGVISAAENMVSAQAYRPDDILTTLSGKTVEIITTDAEGRLVLADALTYVQRNYQPRAVIDLATLTGGVVTALGRVRAGIMGNNQTLIQSLIESGETTMERLWQLPLDDEYLQATKGDDADLKNSGGREGHPIMGGIFLKQFIEDDMPWAHLDIAGTADTPHDLPYCPKGATGFGVRLLVDYLENLK